MAARKANRYAEKYTLKKTRALLEAMIEAVEDDRRLFTLVQVLNQFRIPRRSYYDLKKRFPQVSHTMEFLEQLLEGRVVVGMLSGQIDFRAAQLILRTKPQWTPIQPGGELDEDRIEKALDSLRDEILNSFN